VGAVSLYRGAVRKTFERIQTAYQSRGAAAFLLAAVVLGVLVGFATAVMAWGIDGLETLTAEFGEWSAWGRAAFLVTIPLGILASWLLNKRWGPGVSGGGVTETMVGLGLHGGYLPTRVVPAKIVATVAVLGTGGSGGREGPAALIGAAIGSSLSRYTNFDHDKIRSLVAAGAGAGIGASFNAPIAGMLFAMEVILGSFAIRHLNAVVIASVGAAVTSHLLLGEEQFLTSPPHALGSFAELLLYILLAAIAVGFGLLYLKVLDGAAQIRLPSKVPMWITPVAAGVVVATIGIFWPESLGTGRDFLSGLLALDEPGDFVWGTLFIIAAAKVVTSALTRAGGGSAGSFMPSLVIGGAVGAAFAQAVQPLWTLDSLNPGAFAIVGMACAFATIARAPMTSVIIVFEITGNYELILPLMLGAALATYAGDRFHPESAYTMPLKRKGITLPKNEDIDLLDTVDVRAVMQPTDDVLRPWNTLAEAAEFFDVSSHHGAPVLSDQEKLLGILTLSDITKAGGPSHAVSVAEAMSSDVITVTPDAPVSAALSRMATLGVGRLPVVSELDRFEVVGMFRRESVVKAYDSALSLSKGRELYRERNRIRTQPGADFFEVVVPDKSSVANRDVADISWPKDNVLVSIQRSSSVMVPHGKTTIRTGDTIIAFGSPDAHERLRALVATLSQPKERG
jgi:CIC family chloride channel protein